jgi:hypothetical protein
MWALDDRRPGIPHGDGNFAFVRNKKKGRCAQNATLESVSLKLDISNKEMQCVTPGHLVC